MDFFSGHLGCLASNREPAGLEGSDAGFNAFVILSFESLEQSFEDELCTVARNGHADLLAHALLRAAEHEVVREGLKTSAFTIRQCTVFGPVIDVRAAATRAGDGVCRLLGVKSTVNLGKTCAFHVEAKLGWEQASFFSLPDVHAFGNEGKALRDGLAL